MSKEQPQKSQVATFYYQIQYQGQGVGKFWRNIMVFAPGEPLTDEDLRNTVNYFEKLNKNQPIAPGSLNVQRLTPGNARTLSLTGEPHGLETYNWDLIKDEVNGI